MIIAQVAVGAETLGRTVRLWRDQVNDFMGDLVVERILVGACRLAFMDFDSTMRRFKSSRPSQPVCLLGKLRPTTREKPANGGLLRIRRPVSRLQIWGHAGPNCRKSPDEYPNIPVFGRPTPETEFDRHCMAELAVQFAKFSALADRNLGMPSPHCRAELAVQLAENVSNEIVFGIVGHVGSGNTTVAETLKKTKGTFQAARNLPLPSSRHAQLLKKA